tara:strand:+ start:1793 stop:3040 length:1248 start_codon:yes stop_codon:yes gene_type:complete
MPLNRNFDNFSNFDTNKGIMGDFTHASNLYRRNNFRLTPKVKFLYHVVIDVNPVALKQLGNSVSSMLNKREFNILASSADLPSYTVNTETVNQYNRKKVIQTRINYDEVGIEFHDDAAGLTTLLWEAYYRYYYEDGNYADQGTRPRAYQTGLYDSEPLNTYRHGFNRQGNSVPFFNSISIHQLHHNNADSHHTSFTLVNPILTQWNHDRVDQADGSGTMKNNMRVAYETVLYNRGYTENGNPAGFGDNAHYDRSPSPYSSTSTSSVDKNTNGITDGWTKVFTDIFFEAIGLTEINSLQQKNIRATSPTSAVTSTNTVPFNKDVVFPTNSTTNLLTLAQQFNNISAFQQSGTTAQQQADGARYQSTSSISIATGRNIAESQVYYDSLPTSTKAAIEASLVSGDSANTALRNAGVIQ